MTSQQTVLPEKKLGLGILAGMTTGVFWGLPFLVPQLLTQVPSFEIAFGRFFFFGLISLFWIKKVIRILASLSVKDRIRTVALSATGFWLYTMILFFGVKQTDGIISSLILGLLPVCIPLFTANRKSSGIKFFLGLSLLLTGLANLFLFPVFTHQLQIKSPSLIGVAALFVCLAFWTWYAINNSKFLQSNPQIDRKDFASVMGVVSLACMLPLFLIKVDLNTFVHQEQFPLYLVTAAALGIGASWLANWLWNICSFHCPSEVSGPLIISETIFGLLYSFLYEGRLPHIYEAASIALFLIGVFFAVTSQMAPSRTLHKTH